MKKPTTLGAVGLAALIAVLALLGFSAPAQAYPEVRIDLAVNRSTLYSSQSFTAVGSSNVSCAWTIEWHGRSRSGASSSSHDFRTTFTAPHVTKVTKIALHGTCAYDGSETPTTARTTASSTRTVMITVLPRSAAVSAPGGSDLPNTGGPNLLFLAGGLGLLLAGVTAVSVARRRAEEAEIQAFGA